MRRRPTRYQRGDRHLLRGQTIATPVKELEGPPEPPLTEADLKRQWEEEHGTPWEDPYSS